MQSPHAIWHEQSANGLLDVVFAVDKVNEIFKTATYPPKTFDVDDIPSDIWLCIFNLF